MIGLEALGHEAGDHVGLAGQLVLDHALGVDRIEHGLTHALVVERLLLGVEHDERLIEAIHRLDVGAGGLQGVERLGGDVLHDVALAVLHGGDAGGVIHIHVPHHVGDLRGEFAVVIFVLVELHLLIGDLDVLPRTGADRHLLEVRVALTGRNDVYQRHALLEQGERVLELEVNLVVALRGDRVNEREHRSVNAAGRHDALERGLDVVGGHGVTVRELGAIADRDDVFGVGDLLRFAGGQAGDQRIVGHLQRVQRLGHMPVAGHRQGHGRGQRIEVTAAVRHLRGDGVRDGGTPLGVRRAGSYTAAAQGERSGQYRSGGLGHSGFPRVHRFLLFVE